MFQCSTIKKEFYYAVSYFTKKIVGMVSSNDGVDWRKALNYIIMPKILIMTSNKLLNLDKVEWPFIIQK